MKIITALLIFAMLLAALGGCAQPGANPQQDTQPSSSMSDAEPTPASTPEPTPTPKPTPKPTQIPLSSAAPKAYDYSLPVPKSDAVENSFFDDAVFIGNSRTEGFMLYSGLDNAEWLTHIGLTVDNIFTEPYASLGENKATIMEALAGLTFSKVYIMLGLNELGWVYNSVFQEDYAKIIDEIRGINPDADIYIQSIIPLGAKKNCGGRQLQQRKSA